MMKKKEYTMRAHTRVMANMAIPTLKKANILEK
jgi:hypothetical protein